MEEEQTKQLANLAKYTNRLKTMVIEKNSVEAAVRSLIVAVSCLKNVVVAVMDIALFWTSMEKCCKALATSDLKDTIQDLQEIDKEERIEFYYTDSVMIPLLTYMVQWTAVKSISTDFINGAENTRFRLNETITKADKAEMSREQHWDLASKTAGNVANNLNRQVAESNKKISTENAAPFFFDFKNVSSYFTDTKSQQHGTDRQQQIRRHGDQFIMIKIFTDTDDHIKRQ